MIESNQRYFPKSQQGDLFGKDPNREAFLMAVIAEQDMQAFHLHGPSNKHLGAKFSNY